MKKSFFPLLVICAIILLAFLALPALATFTGVLLMRAPANNTFINGTYVLNVSLSSAVDNVTSTMFYYRNLSGGGYVTIGVNQTRGPSNFTRSFDTTTLADGRYEFFVNASEDPGGTVISNASGNVTIDRTVPVLNITTPTASEYKTIGADGFVWINGTVYDNLGMRNVNISDNSTDFTIWSFSGTNNTGFTVRNNTYVADGAVNINLGYVDFAGNAGNATRLFYIDTVAPSITITSPTATAYGSSSITLAYTASDAVSGISSCSYRLDSASATTAGSSVSTTLNVNDGSRTITVTCTDGVGYSTTQSVTFTVSVGGGPPSTYVGSPSNDQSKIIIPSMKEGASKTINITKGEHGIRQITISVNNNVNSINIEISKLPGQPASVTKEISGKVYKYMEINKTNIKSEDISKIKIRFVVDKKWLEENNVSADSVVLNRYTTEWNKLPTTKVGETANEIEYEAESPGLSLFAVSSEPKAQAPAQPEVPQAPAQTKVSEPQTDMTFYIAILAVIVALVAAAAIYLRKSGKKK